jgi:hypothetical protein
MTQAGRGDPDEDLARPRRVQLKLLEGQRFGHGVGGLRARGVEHGGGDLHRHTSRG